jgi:general secretion pathway protein D
MTKHSKRLAAFFLSLAILGCAQNQPYIDARTMVESGNVDEGLARIEEQMKKNPGDAEIRNYYNRQKAMAVQRYLSAADNARSAGQLDQAEQGYQLALRFDPQNARATEGAAGVTKDRASAAKVAEAESAMKKGDSEEALAKAKEILAENPGQRNAKAIVRKTEEKKAKEESAPKLNVALKKPITMEFRDAPLRTVFELISKRTGLNFVFDRDVPADAKATVFVKDTNIDEVIRFVLVTNQLEKKTLNDNTILIYPNTPQKQQAYRELTVKSFYLANADVKQTANMVRQLVKTRDLFIDEKLNLLVVRDTPEAIRTIEKLIANQDLGEAEVMLEVQVLEVGYSKLQQLGIQWPGSLGVSLVGAAGVAGQITGKEAQSGLNMGLVRLSVPDPLIQFNAKQQNGRTNVLANPRIRVKSKEKAKIHIGDKVPVVTTTAGATGFVSESVNYLDVGLKLDVEPQVYLEDDVGIKISLEVSNVAGQTKTNSGTTAYQIGTRNASTTLRLKDGETQVLAGLINDEDRRSANRVPGLADLPGLGRLFSNNDDTVNKTEVVLLLTPRVIRNIERPGVKLEEFNSGTEAEVGGAALQLTPQGPSASGASPSIAPAPVPGPAPIPSSPPPSPTPAPTPGAAPAATVPVIPANPPAAGKPPPG